jgi:hypothetical protein
VSAVSSLMVVLAGLAAGLPAVIPQSPQVRDPVFAVLVGLVENDLYGDLPEARLRSEVLRSGRPTKLPLGFLRDIRRVPMTGRERARIVVTADRPIDLPAPYDILGYHPGRFRASPVLVLDEWNLGTVRLGVRGSRDAPDSVAELEDVHLWGIQQGYLDMDVDGWLDAIMGDRLDDTRIAGFVLFRYRGELIGIATGYNKDGEGRSGAFRFKDDTIVFPGEPAFMAAGAAFRARLERLMPAISRFRRG